MKNTKMHFALAVVCIAAIASSAGGQSNAVGSIRRLDPAFDRIIPTDAKIEKVHGDFRFTEGPVWIRDGGYLLFSDVRGNAIMKWAPDGTVSAFRKPIFSGPYPDGASVGSNGLTLDPQGRLIAAEHGNRRVSRTEKNGSITLLADRYDGKRLNSPNDLVCKRNGDIYFTDPPGLYGGYPGDPSKAPQRELDFNGVYRVTAAGKLELLLKDVPFPNGLAFSPDEKKFYLANTRPDKYWMVYDVNPDGTLANGKVLLDVTKEPGEGVPDGMKVDAAGNIYAAAPGGIAVITPQGKQLGVLTFPEQVANLAWGDADGKTLYVTARTGLYRIRTNATGIRP